MSDLPASPDTEADGGDLDSSLADLSAAIRVLDRLAARRYYRPIFRLLPKAVVTGTRPRAADDVRRSEEDPAQIIAEVFKNPKDRCDLERLIECEAGLPRGTVVIHCPSYSGPAKIANILIFARDPQGKEDAVPLRKIGGVFNELFKDHETAIEALENMYKSMWRLVVSVAPPFYVDYKRLSECVEKCIVDYLVRQKRKFEKTITVNNDPIMLWELQEAEREADASETFDVETEPREPYAEIPAAFLEAASSSIVAAITSGDLACPGDLDNWPQHIVDAINGRPMTRTELGAIFKRFNPSVKITGKLKSIQGDLVQTADALSPSRRALMRADLRDLVPDEPLAEAARDTSRMVVEKLDELNRRYRQP